jgi:hypothetical protein
VHVKDVVALVVPIARVVAKLSVRVHVKDTATKWEVHTEADQTSF